MSEESIRKVKAWLSFQEEVFGPFRIPEPESGSVGLSQPESLAQRQPESETHHQSASQPDYPGLLSRVETLDELRELCSLAEILKTDLVGTNLVFGVGNPDADLMLIGEAPGEQEDRQGEPFVGKAGQLLNKILKAIHFEREQVYIANILKHRPPKNRDPQPEEREKSLPFLMKQIELIDPKLILCLGRISAQTLLETTAPMKDLRGRFHKFRDRHELLVTFHPAALLRNPAWKRDTWEDVQLLRKRYDELGGRP
jgi:uracil-DNA glycosylase